MIMTYCSHRYGNIVDDKEVEEYFHVWLESDVTTSVGGGEVDVSTLPCYSESLWR
jgi:hypothetical protein